MGLIQDTPGLSAHLAAGEAVDHEHPVVREAAARPAKGVVDSRDHAHDYARAAHTFVRDAIPHAQDAGDPRVTWRASDVLRQRTGICHAKAHALAALLRAEGIPAALCRQRLTQDGGGGHVVHGPVAVRLDGTWHRQDPRGDKPGLDAQFSLTGERPAFVPDPKSSEVDYPVLYAEPHPAVLAALKAAPDRPRLWQSLPDAL